MTNITHNLPLFNHESFGLSEGGQVADQEKFCVGLQALIDRPREAIRVPQLVERVFKVISGTDLSDWPTAGKVEALVAKVKDQWVKVSLGDSFRHIPRVRLENDCGPKFKQQYMHNLADAKAHELPLSLPEDTTSDAYPTQLTEAFLSFLQTGEISEAAFDENVLNLLDLALQHTQEPLVWRYVNFLEDNLDIDSLETYLTYAKERNCRQLKWACLRFIQENLAEIPEEMQNKHPVLFQLIKSLQDKKVTLQPLPSGQAELHIKALDTTIPLLEQINREIPIHSLVMARAIDPLPFLEKIAPHLPELQELIICNEDPTVQEIPTLKKLFPKLTAFGNKAPFLKTFEEVETYLQSFTKPGASESGSETLTLRSLNLQLIQTLDDVQMDKLTEYLQDVHYLFIKSNNITSVVVPGETSLVCGDCTVLASINAPKATSVRCYSCTVLATVDVPEATTIDYSSCKALKVLTAPNAIRITCDQCEMLTTLKAPNATRIFCIKCPMLITLEAPNATKIDCHCCDTLTTLDAPKGTDIRIFRCEALAILKAPKATKVRCSGCTELTTLEAPEAAEIRCGLCKALTTLKAPKATKIHCNFCEALTTLDAPEATQINCISCAALTTIDAPNAKLTGISRMSIKSRMWWNQIQSFWSAALVFCAWLQDSLIRIIKALFRR